MEGMTNDEKIPVSLREKFTNIAANTDNREQYRQYENDLKVMDFEALFNTLQNHISTNFSELLGCNNKDKVIKEQLNNIITRYIKNEKIKVEGYSLTGLVEKLYQEMAELSILTPLLDTRRTDIEEININRWDDIKVHYDNGEIISYPETFRSPEHALDVIKRMLKQESTLILDQSRPIVRGHLHSRIRLTVLGEGVIDKGAGVSASLRIINPKQFKGTDFITRGTATEEMLETLSILTRYGVSICITGETGSGKTTLLMYLAGNIDNNKRIFCIEEDVREFDLTKRDDNGKVINNVIHTHTRKSGDDKQSVDQDNLLETALTMNPDVIVVSEMKGREANAAQEASRTGHSVLTTTHAASCRATYKRMVTLCKKAVSMDEKELLELVKEAFPIVVFIQKDEDNVRRIKEITECYLDDAEKYQIKTLYRHVVESNEKIDDKMVIKGKYDRVEGISKQLKERLINKNITKELLDKLI